MLSFWLSPPGTPPSGEMGIVSSGTGEVGLTAAGPGEARLAIVKRMRDVLGGVSEELPMRNAGVQWLSEVKLRQAAQCDNRREMKV